MTLRPRYLDLGVGPHESLDAVEDALDVSLIGCDRSEAQPRSLPQILVVDFGSRHTVAMARGVEKVADYVPLVLERPALRNVNLDK